MPLANRTWPANGGTSGDVLTHYGPRTTDASFGGVVGRGVTKKITYDINYTDLDSTTAHAVNGLDVIIPKGASLMSCRLVVETAVVGPTLIIVGTYKATDGTTAIDADGLLSTAVATVDAIGDVVVGAGPQLTTGTGAAVGALQEDAVIRILPTGAAATAGKFRVFVEYLMPVA